MTTGPEDTTALVPTWLVGVVVLLLVAVSVATVFVVREMRDRAQTPAPGATGLSGLEQAARKDPTDVAVQLDLAALHQEAGRLDEALAAYRLVLAQDPGQMDALYGKGLALLALGRADDAEEPLLEVLARNPEHVGAAHALGTHYLAADRFEELLQVVEPAAEASIGVAELCYLMGRAHEHLGNEAMAETCYRNALDYVPDMSTAHEGLSRLGVE